MSEQSQMLGIQEPKTPPFEQRCNAPTKLTRLNHLLEKILTKTTLLVSSNFRRTIVVFQN